MSIEMPGPEFDRLVESLDIPDEAPALERLRRRPRRFRSYPENLTPAEATKFADDLRRFAEQEERR
jgi:hypothetical protein